MKIIWSPRALKNFEALRDYIAKDSPEHASEVATRILYAVDVLARHPHIGRLGRTPGTRELVISGTPYLIPHRIRENAIELIAIIHGRQKWPTKF